MKPTVTNGAATANTAATVIANNASSNSADPLSLKVSFHRPHPQYHLPLSHSA